MKQLGFKFPIALDTEWKTLIDYWLVPGKRRWTSVSFLIDKIGKNSLYPSGRGIPQKDGQAKQDYQSKRAYLELKAEIKKLLAEPKQNAKVQTRKDD